MSLLTSPATPPAIAYGAEPFTVAEIDSHPDAARLWATVKEMREEAESLLHGEYRPSWMGSTL